jgi:hypothetical protein
MNWITADFRSLADLVFRRGVGVVLRRRVLDRSGDYRDALDDLRNPLGKKQQESGEDHRLCGPDDESAGVG